MRGPSAAGSRRGSRGRVAVIAVVGAVAAVASVVAISIVWPGLDAKNTPPAETAVWALQTGSGRHYARVNTAIGELDTVRSIANPSAVAQTGDTAYLFSESYGKLTRIDDALPSDLDDEALRASPSTPAGTVEASVTGDFVAYRTDSGAVYAGTLSGGAPHRVSAVAGGRDITADAIAVDDAGIVYAYSRAAGAVLRYSIPNADLAGRDALRDGPTGSAVSLTAAGGTWFLVDADAGRLWERGRSASRTIGLVGTVAFGQPTAGGTAAWIADDTGLVRLPVDGSAPTRVFGGGTRDLGTPARPIVRDGVLTAAWLGPASGTLWRSDAAGDAIPGASAKGVALGYGGKRLGDDRRPVFVASGSSMILNETRTGWVWDAATARLLPSSQDWSLDDRTNPQSQQSDQQASVVIDPKPPIAEPDAFGVRAGSLVSLPVLLNDHDPNEDVLSIDPGSVTGLDPSFGTLSVTDDQQRIAVQVAAGATGTATFRYRITDGTGADGGLYSNVTTVTLTVHPASENSAPQWCGVSGCLASWPSPQVAPGGTVSVPVMDGWVDPDGDPVMLLSVVNESGDGTVATTPTGAVVYQHPNPSSTEAQVVQLQVTVGDTHGATTVRPLTVRITPRPKLTAESFTVVDSQSSGLSVDVGPHVTGTEGRMSLTAVRVLDEAKAEAVATAAGTSFDFTARSPGIYRVAYTVGDGTSEASATARITILPPDASAQLSTAPVVAFVRPKQDVTLDVFAAVTNPTHRVLLLSDPKPIAASGANMSVDVVGQNYLRISGSTSDGAPGLLGTVRYTVSDGTDDVGARVTGEATVYLLPPSPDLAPIAVDDTVVVRAGAQVDIPVLDNDVATTGGGITLNPASIRSSAKDALAFASGRLLRYLAPDRPGQYTVEYSIYTTGSPDLSDTATVRITVISDDSNRAPRPRTLEGRVLSGQSTTIPFRSFGVDPDGDQVSLDRITSQPTCGSGSNRALCGSATISPDGESIVYTSVPGFHGQASFTYRVVDSFGATGTASVRVGVLGEQANPSPVTFTDYVQLQTGAENQVRVSPLANDIDPTGGTLKLVDVVPDLVKTFPDGTSNPEYPRLAALVGRVTSSQVTIAAGTTPGTMSFLYDVQSSTGNTARGLIVVKVVREAVPDYPVVTDTVLTAETRDRFPSGVDVVDSSTSWTGGDIGALTLSLWGSPAGVSVDGHRLKGQLTAQSRIIPFRLSGRGASGERVTTYGFLRIPGENDVTLALKPDVVQQVKERGQVTWDMADLVTVPSGAQLDVGSPATPTGARAQARCTVAGTKVTYIAGDGAPWADACVVPVRLHGQSDWTYLSVPITVTALTPVPVLQAASITVAPGQTVSYDLKQLTAWQGRTDWGRIVYTVQYGGSDFTVDQGSAQGGSVLRITGKDAAPPGDEEVAVIGVSSHPGVAPARLILRVGAAPSALPQGGTASQTCSEANGSSCTATVVGAPGEVNPLPRTPLEVVAVAPTGACIGVQFSVASASTVRATWSGDAPGQKCTASVTLRDAQGRVTSADRAAHLLLDLQGFPKAPDAVVQTAYADGSLTLRVSPGQATLAYPALSGFRIRYGGAVVATCTPDGTCPAISAPNGEMRTYTATAVNAVGESRGSVSTVAWAYDPPPAPTSVAATPVPAGPAGGVVSLTITGVDPAQTASLHITSDQGTTVDVPVGAGTTVVVPSYNVGSNTASRIVVTPASRFPLPPGAGSGATGLSAQTTGNGIGAPLNAALTLTSAPDGDRTVTITATGSASSGGDGSTLRYGIVPHGRTCTVSDGGQTATFSSQPVANTYSYDLCVESWYQGQSFARATVTQSITVYPSSAAPKGYTFVVGPRATVTGSTAQWLIGSEPTTSTETPPRGTTAKFSGYPSSVIGSDPGIQVWYQWQSWQSSQARVVPAAGSAPYQLQATWQVAQCRGGQPLAVSGSSTDGKAAIAFDTSAVRYYDANGAEITTATPGIVPIGAVAVQGIGVTVSWAAQNWGLDDVSQTFGDQCDPNTP